MSFAEAVTETGTGEQQPPVDRTLSGLSTGKVREQVQKSWDQIRFRTDSGKKIVYSARLETEAGSMTWTFLPEFAPNHVRNFVALARAGYYDGLLFEHVIEQQGDSGEKLHLIEGGCPAGTGEIGIGHLGYWLKPEFSDSISHEIGMVGACRDDQADTAACRFYINLSKAPVMDGNFTIFAKVTEGLEVARDIGQLPRPDGSQRPLKPTVIRKVTILSREVD